VQILLVCLWTWSFCCSSYLKVSSVLHNAQGRVTIAVSRRLPIAAAWFDRKSGHVGFVMKKVALEQVSSEYFGFPCQFPLHQMLHIHCHPGLVQ
jgi:hypothetical protein